MSGSLKSPTDPRDWIYEGLARGNAASLPTEFSMIDSIIEIRDQGTRGTCAAFVGASIKSLQHHRNTGKYIQLSPEFIYYHRTNRPSSGMFGRNVFQVLQKLGTSKESVFPYGNKLNPSKSVYQQALKFRISSYARVTTLEGLKQALYEIGPCYLLLPLYKTRPEFWRPNTDEEELADQTHAVMVVGYTHKGFMIVNSWGKTWNMDGMIIIPYDDWSDDWEIWVSMDSDSEQLRSSKILKKRKKNRRLSRRYSPVNSSSDSSSNESQCRLL